MTQHAKIIGQDDNAYYAAQLQAGRQFEGYIAKALYRKGIVIVAYASKKDQLAYGENILGMEIKRDANFRATGNLFIEMAEKTAPQNKEFVPSGICRNDNSWLYLIGDEGYIWIFGIKHLRMLASRYDEIENRRGTARGFLLPIAVADKYCLRTIALTNED